MNPQDWYLQMLLRIDRIQALVNAIATLSESISWSGVTIDDMRAFLSGCGCDFCDPHQMRRVDEYVRSRPTWQYLRKSADWKRYYEPMLRRYIASVTNKR